MPKFKFWKLGKAETMTVIHQTRPDQTNELPFAPFANFVSYNDNRY